MKKIGTVIASFIVMLCLGGVYAWSMFAAELISKYHFSSSQTQIIFGCMIAVFPIVMIYAGRLEKKISSQQIAALSGVFFSAGYILAGSSNGNYWMILLGIGILGGIGTGLGYLIALTTPVKCFPDKKGLITGIAAAGFGLGAIVLSNIAEIILHSQKTILHCFINIGILYGIIIIIASYFIRSSHCKITHMNADITNPFKEQYFYKLFYGIFSGTFAGLLVIGSLKSIGAQHGIDDHVLVLGISVFAAANFLGRLCWGMLSDRFSTYKCIFSSLLMQGIAILLFGNIHLTELSYLSLAGIISFGFGANFVLFAKETSHTFGIHNLSAVYPFVFLGYALAGILGPITGGMIFDMFKNYSIAAYIAAGISILGGSAFLFNKE